MAYTIQSVSTSDLPFNHKYGSTTTLRRRVMISIVGTCTAAGDTVDLSTYVPSLKQIDGIAWASANDVGTAVSTALTWGAGSTTITFTNAASGTFCYKIGAIGHLTGGPGT
jgi:hypothetical protein